MRQAILAILAVFAASSVSLANPVLNFVGSGIDAGISFQITANGPLDTPGLQAGFGFDSATVPPGETPVQWGYGAPSGVLRMTTMDGGGNLLTRTFQLLNFVNNGVYATIGAPDTGTLTVTGSTDATTTTVSAIPVTGTPSTDILLTASVVSAVPGTLGGQVEFFNGGISLGSSPLDGSGAATMHVNLPLGDNSITATYQGSTAYGRSDAAPVIVPIVAAQSTSTSTSLVATPTTAVIGTSVQLQATVTADVGTPDGQVEFLLGGATSLGLAPLVGGVATLPVTTLPLGPNSVTASYAGSGLFNPSTSSSVTVTIKPSLPAATNTPGEFYLFAQVVPIVAPGTGIVTISRTGAQGVVTVAYTTADGTAQAGRDYVATSGVATFSAGQTEINISIPLLSAALPGLTFSVQLSNPTGGATIRESSEAFTLNNASPYGAAAVDAFLQAGSYFAQGDQANGYFSLGYYNYYVYLLTPSNTDALNNYYGYLADAYYLSYEASGEVAAGLAWYNYYRSFLN